MTDRFNSLTVVLDKDYREDDAQVLIAAIKILRGVIEVTGNVADVQAFVAESRARREMAEKLFAALASYTLDKV